MSDFMCAVLTGYRSACEGLDLYREHEGRQYCVLHFPGEDKKDDFKQALQSKRDQKDYDFGGVYFPGDTAAFESSNFEEPVNFSGATFSGVANFTAATFNEAADFTCANFKGKPNFSDAIFKREVNFSAWRRVPSCSVEVTFENGANFRFATFENSVTFSRATFKEKADFNHTVFRDEARFSGPQAFDSKAGVDFRDTRMDKPKFLSMHEICLRPSWFVEVNAREFDFTKVEWYGMLGAEGSLDKEINALKKRGVGSPYTLLAQACRRLSANAEDNREYPLANEFHYWSMDAARKGDWNFFKNLTWRDLLKWDSWPAIARHFGLITTLYWALSGYGARAARAFWVLAGMCAAFAVLYMLLGPTELRNLGQAVVYSLLAIARLNPEPRPEEPGLFQFLVGLEGILGPLQIALLALAVRRKVMR